RTRAVNVAAPGAAFPCATVMVPVYVLARRYVCDARTEYLPVLAWNRATPGDSALPSPQSIITSYMRVGSFEPGSANEPTPPDNAGPANGRTPPPATFAAGSLTCTEAGSPLTATKPGPETVGVTSKAPSRAYVCIPLTWKLSRPLDTAAPGSGAVPSPQSIITARSPASGTGPPGSTST